MKKALLILLLVALGIPGYKMISENPSEITNPVYIESRVVVDIPEISRELEYVFVGEMVSEKDCQTRSQRYLNNLFEKCVTCKIKLTKCNPNLHERYKRLFSGYRTYTTYLSFDRGNRFERNGRMVIWGLNEEEAKMACQEIKGQIKEKYSGTVECIVGSLS